MKKVVLVQSNYIPWKGYFDLIAAVDEFILFDDMQYTRRDWRNRNRIKSPAGSVWLTIPVEVKGRYSQRIRETRISNPSWSQRHWKSIAQNYARARYFGEYFDFFEELYLKTKEPLLSQVNYRFFTAICRLLNIRTKLSWSMDYRLIDGKTERLVDLCCQARATEYLSGSSTKEYTDEALFQQADILLRYLDYSGYPDHYVSIVDMIPNEGPNAIRCMNSFPIT